MELAGGGTGRKHYLPKSFPHLDSLPRTGFAHCLFLTSPHVPRVLTNVPCPLRSPACSRPLLREGECGWGHLWELWEGHEWETQEVQHQVMTAGWTPWDEGVTKQFLLCPPHSSLPPAQQLGSPRVGPEISRSVGCWTMPHSA